MARKRIISPGPYLLRLQVDRAAITDPQRHPFQLPAIGNLTTLPLHAKVTFFVGENGSGKSTLLEAIATAYGLNAEGGSRHFNFSTRRTEDPLADVLRLIKAPSQPRTSYFLRAESFFNVATQVEEMGLIEEYGLRSLHEQSHGESFFALFHNRFYPQGLYLMDEPEAALSPQRQLQFLALLHQHVLSGSQFIIATHSPIIMAYPDAVIYHFRADGIHETTYTDTEHYQVTKAFLHQPQRSLSILFEDAEPVSDD